jgi:hypothetical protein
MNFMHFFCIYVTTGFIGKDSVEPQFLARLADLVAILMHSTGGLVIDYLNWSLGERVLPVVNTRYSPDLH